MQSPQDAFGRVLRNLRTKKGFSQERLALDGDIDRTFISMLERGIRQPSLTSMITIAKVLGMSASALMNEVEMQMKSNICEEDNEDS